jgi:hypothetical protein
LQLPPDQSETERSNSSIFAHPNFREQLMKHPINPSHEQIQSIPELLKIHEEALRKKKEEDLGQLQIEFDNNLVTPRTFQRKHEAIECWVSN